MTTHAAVVTAIERLLRGEIVAIILQGDAGFVQFAEHGTSELVLEAAGDEVLSERLSPTQLRQLIEPRFDPPDRSVSPNHTRYLARSTPPADLATIALETMATVYGAEPGSIELNEV